MPPIDVGQKAPSFRLLAGHGGEISLDDFRGRSHAVVWFTKGMACPFCRTQMSQLARGYPRLKAAGAEVLMITPTRPDRARFYARNFSIPFVYLCDPDYVAHQDWGVVVRRHSIVWYAKLAVTMSRMEKPMAEIGNPKPTLGEFPALLHDSDMALFVVDRGGIVRYRQLTAYAGPDGFSEIPSVDEILAQVERCAKSA